MRLTRSLLQQQQHLLQQQQQQRAATATAVFAATATTNQAGAAQLPRANGPRLSASGSERHSPNASRAAGAQVCNQICYAS